MPIFLDANPKVSGPDFHPEYHWQLAIQKLMRRGHRVEICADIPGLFRIDGGPELTTGQLIGVAAKSDALMAR